MIHVECQWVNGSYLVVSASSLSIQRGGYIAFGKVDESLEDFVTGLKSLRIKGEGALDIEFDSGSLEDVSELKKLDDRLSSSRRSIDTCLLVEIIKSYLKNNSAEKARRKIRQFPLLVSNLLDGDFADAANEVAEIKNRIEGILEKELTLTMDEISERLGGINMDIDYLLESDLRFRGQSFFKCPKCGKWIPCDIYLKEITHSCQEYDAGDQRTEIKRYYLTKLET